MKDASKSGSKVISNSNKVIVDSKKQAIIFGNSFKAIQNGFITQETLQEFGDTLQKGISSNVDLIISDFIGIAAQDIAISQFVIYNTQIS